MNNKDICRHKIFLDNLPVFHPSNTLPHKVLRVTNQIGEISPWRIQYSSTNNEDTGLQSFRALLYLLFFKYHHLVACSLAIRFFPPKSLSWLKYFFIKYIHASMPCSGFSQVSLCENHPFITTLFLEQSVSHKFQGSHCSPTQIVSLFLTVQADILAFVSSQQDICHCQAFS